MRYLLDTNIVSDLIRNPQGQVTARITERGDDAVCTSVIVAAELRYGAARRGSERLTRQVEQVLAALPIVPFEEPADVAYANIRARLESMGAPIGGYDLLIAAHAVSLGCALVTGNQREFGRVEGLQVLNWLR